jgi:hypothetical protein
VDALAEKKFAIVIGGAEFRGADGVAGADETREGFGGSGIRIITIQYHVEIHAARGERGGDGQDGESFSSHAQSPYRTPHKSNFTCKM